MTQSANKFVPSEVYTREYYETNCQGYDEFQRTQGTIIPHRLRLPLSLAAIESGMSVLDVGCGRGEILIHASQQAAWTCGFDYAIAALEIASESIAAHHHSDKTLIHLGNARNLPYLDDQFDRVFMLDVVEHLYPSELHEVFVEIQRVLSPTGRLIIHTMPNTWYYRFGYPIYRFVQQLRGKKLPANPRDRWGYKEVHVNEQNPIALRRALRMAGFKTKVWLRSTQSYTEEPNKYARLCMRALVTIYPFRWIFCNDLFAVATK